MSVCTRCACVYPHFDELERASHDTGPLILVILVGALYVIARAVIR